MRENKDAIDTTSKEVRVLGHALARELSNAELELVSGGTGYTNTWTGPQYYNEDDGPFHEY